jgi:hypothetical protein
MSCKCKNIIENFQGGEIPLNTKFLSDVEIDGTLTGGSPLTIGDETGSTLSLQVSGSTEFSNNINVINGSILSGGTDLLNIFSGGGGTPNLSSVLTEGNETSGNNITMTEGDDVIFKYAGFSNNINTLPLTTNRVINFPNNDGTVALTSDIQDTFVTGGTVNNGVLTLERNDSNSIQINRVNSGFFAQTGDSATVTNTTDETTLLGSGVGSLSVPGNTFQIGDSYALNMGGKLRTDGAGESITIRIDAISGSSRVEIATSGVIDLDNLNTLRDFVLEVEFTIRNTGGPGTASLMTSGYFDYVKNNGDLDGVLFSSLESTNFDTTVTKTLDVTVEWGAASADNQIYSHIAILRKIF